MVVLFIRSNPVNPDSRVEKEVAALLELGYKVIIVGWDRNNDYMIKESYINFHSGKAKVIRFGISTSFGGGFKKNIIPLLKFQIILYRWLKKNRNEYDCIHACDFDTAYISSKIAKRYRKKLVYDIFDYYVDSFSVPKILHTFVEAADTKVINSADSVIICSEQREEQIIHTHPSNLIVIHNSPSEELLVDEGLEFNLNSDKVKIVFAGTLLEKRFLRETSEYIMHNDKYEFHIAGFGPNADFFDKLSQNTNNIFYYGKISYSNVLKLEASCDIMIAMYDPTIPNHYYAAPNKFYEALMLGKPIIMCRNTGVDKVIEKNKLGKVIDYDVQDFEQALEELSNSKEQWQDISKKAKNIYRELYNWNLMKKRLQKMYIDVIEVDIK